MSYDVVMPQLGMTMTEGAVLEWLKQPGDHVEKGDLLFIVETDKATVEVEAQANGTLDEIVLAAGDVVPVGTVIARISNQNEIGTSDQLRVEPPSQSPMTASDEVSNIAIQGALLSAEIPSINLHSSPRAKKLARELEIDINSVPSYGDGERITEADVRRFFNESKERDSIDSTATVPATVMSAARRAIAERMTTSFQTVPHFYLTAVADATELIRLKEQLNARTAGTPHTRVTHTDLLLKCFASALSRHPEINIYWQDGVVERKRVNIGLAAQIADRLLVPVIRDVDRLTISEIAELRHAVLERIRQASLRADDLADASATLTNLGMERVDSFQAIINLPESIILATGRIAPRPTVIDGVVISRHTIYLSLSVDHRVIDGSAAAKFLTTLVNVIETGETPTHDSLGRRAN